MYIDWLINNTVESRGFISRRVHLVTYSAICTLYGSSFIMDHGRTCNGITIGRILKPTDLYQIV